MDARIDPAAAFGISLGDAHVIRNAGIQFSELSLRCSDAYLKYPSETVELTRKIPQAGMPGTLCGR